MSATTTYQSFGNSEKLERSVIEVKSLTIGNSEKKCSDAIISLSSCKNRRGLLSFIM